MEYEYFSCTYQNSKLDLLLVFSFSMLFIIVATYVHIFQLVVCMLDMLSLMKLFILSLNYHLLLLFLILLSLLMFLLFPLIIQYLSQLQFLLLFICYISFHLRVYYHLFLLLLLQLQPLLSIIPFLLLFNLYLLHLKTAIPWSLEPRQA